MELEFDNAAEVSRIAGELADGRLDDESDRAVRIARIISLAEQVFSDDAKASRWLSKVKTRFEGRSPLEMLCTEAGARSAEEMLLQLDYGFTV
jgi:putative toxin-antitoxin system antitoxin component (TIGR02293 family)